MVCLEIPQGIFKMAMWTESNRVWYARLSADEVAVLRSIEDEVVNFVRDILGSSCRPIWSAVDEHGVRTVRLAVADLHSLIAFSISSTDLLILDRALLIQMLETSIHNEMIEV